MTNPPRQPYPPRHPPVPPAATRGETTPSRQADREPRLPDEHDESRHSQARATESQKQVGRDAYRNATDGTQDTDRGPVLDRVYKEAVAPDRGHGPPRQ